MEPAPLDWLYSLAQFGIKFGLDNIHAIVAELGHPERHFRSVHVAGTNGKGSVTAMVETALRRAGVRTGRYTSPHLLDLSERFAVNGEAVSQPAMLGAVTTVRDAVERLRARGTLDVHPTFFEVTTAVAFELFRSHGVEVAVCEVGLGGRLDATNVLSPMACAITSIGFDHEQYLGSTLAAIAAEKAGIIKKGTPVVLGTLAPEAAAVIEGRANEVAAPIVRASDHVRVGPVSAEPDCQQFAMATPLRDYGRLRLALAGAHQVGNAVVAVRLLETLEAAGLAIGRDAIAAGLSDVRWPGRMERLLLPDGREALLDAAHNADGADVLARHLRERRDRRPMVFAAMRDKDASGMLRRMLPQVSHLVVTRASNPRSAEPAELAALARSLAPALPIDTVEPPAAALARAWEYDRRIVVAGSIFLLADVMKELGRS